MKHIIIRHLVGMDDHSPDAVFRLWRKLDAEAPDFGWRWSYVRRVATNWLHAQGKRTGTRRAA